MAGIEVAVALAFGAVFLAELGDKSELVCLMLATQRPAFPVWLGATAAFAILNALAVTVGAGLGAVVPRAYMLGAASLLFIVFGALSLRAGAEEVEPIESRARGTFVTTFSLMFVAELGDKTQLSVAALASGESPLGTWIGATLALSLSSLGAVIVGHYLGARIPPRWLRRVGGLAFLATGGYLAWLTWRAAHAA